MDLSAQEQHARFRRARLNSTLIALITTSAITIMTMVFLMTLPSLAQTPPQPPLPAGGTQPEESAAQSPQVEPDMRRVAACKAQALTKLKERSPSIEDIHIDIDGLTIAESNARLGDAEVKGVIMGEAYIQRDRADRANRFLCLTGAQGEVLFTFFTER